MRRLFFVLLLVALSLSVNIPALAQDAPPFSGTVNSSSNLRAGPSTGYSVVGGAAPGQAVQVNACNDDCTWYQLSTGNWIAAFLVDVNVTSAPLSPTAVPKTTTPGPLDGLTLTPATVVSITDGDTIRVLIDGVEYRLRYIGMNAPEGGQPFADEAAALNRSLVAGKTVLLEKDVSETDRYQRLLRYVWLEDGTLVNYELVRRGYAQAATYPPDVKYEAHLREAQRLATEEGAGLWATSVPVETSPAPVVSQPRGATVNSNANLREGPGTNYPVVGSASAGQSIVVVGRTSAFDWYQLSTGVWIAAFLVNNAPADIPVSASPISTATQPSISVPQKTTTIDTSPPLPQNCDPSYPTVCIPPSPPDLDCGDISYRRFQVLPPDPHRFDGDNDGVGCESG